MSENHQSCDACKAGLRLLLLSWQEAIEKAAGALEKYSIPLSDILVNIYARAIFLNGLIRDMDQEIQSGNFTKEMLDLKDRYLYELDWLNWMKEPSIGNRYIDSNKLPVGKNEYADFRLLSAESYKKMVEVVLEECHPVAMSTTEIYEAVCKKVPDRNASDMRRPIEQAVSHLKRLGILMVMSKPTGRLRGYNKYLLVRLVGDDYSTNPNETTN